MMTTTGQENKAQIDQSNRGQPWNRACQSNLTLETAPGCAKVLQSRQETQFVDYSDQNSQNFSVQGFLSKSHEVVTGEQLDLEQPRKYRKTGPMAAPRLR